ncbi:autotransporter outer membrane beta-barrel domain-containing protein, partial [Zavarzinella formosa]|uniref:hypothetical protein n=1 Tax=Zavarzinella formosa TaxID=360055 RepID=UPI00187D7BFF
KIAVIQDDPNGTGKGPIKGIYLQDTDATKSVLTITVVRAKGGDGLVGIGAIEGSGLKTLSAAKSDLTGGGIMLGGTPAQSTSITLNNINDNANISIDGGIAALTAAQFGGGSIVAASVGTLAIKGDFSANVTLSGQGVAAGKPTLTSARIGGNLIGSAWNVTGAIGSITAGGFDSGSITADILGTLAITKNFGAAVTLSGQGVAAGKPTLTSARIGGAVQGGDWNVSGAIGSITAGQFDSGSISAYSLGTLTVARDFNAGITLSGQGVAADKPALATVRIGGTVKGEDWDVAGNVGSITVGAFINSSLSLTYTPADPDNPMFGGTFSGNFKLTTFTVTGVKGSTGEAFANSIVAAKTVGAVSLKSVATDNGGVQFGIVAKTGIGSVRVTSPRFAYDKNQPTPQGTGDFCVNLV